MKVLFDHQCFIQQRYGGVSRYYYHLIKELRRFDDVSVHLPLLRSNNYYLNSEPDFKVRPFFPNKNFYYKRTILDYINQFSMNGYLKKSDYDIFHPTYYNPYFLKHLNNRTFIITVYDLIHEKFPEIINLIDKTSRNKKIIINSASHILAISESTKNDLINIYNIPSKKIEVVYLAASINKDLSYPKEKMNLPRNYVLYVGNRNFYKNFLNFILAMEPLLKKHKDLFVISAGGGSFTNGEIKFFKSKNLLNKIVFSSAEDAVLATLYSYALAFVFPTRYEGFGIPVLEAMNCECPVVMSNTSSLPEVGGDAAVYFDPEDILDMKKKIESVIFNDALRQDLIAKGKIQGSLFSFKKTAQKTLEVYKKLLNK